MKKNKIKPPKLSSEKLARIAALAQKPIEDNFKALQELLSNCPTGLLVNEAAKKIGTNEQGINTILASTNSKDISTFYRQTGELKLKYIILTVNLSNVA